MKNQHKNISRFMSLILRHKPEVIGVQLDENGWLEVDQLIEGINKQGKRITLEILKEVVANNDKKRFIFNEDGTKIRANQGHSIEVDVELKETIPPAFLYHGTVNKTIKLIQKSGLKKMSRQHVHLSQDRDTAFKVGSRRGFPVILSIDTGRMHQDGYQFYLSENEVWLTDHVPVKYISFKS